MQRVMMVKGILRYKEERMETQEGERNNNHEKTVKDSRSTRNNKGERNTELQGRKG